MHAAPFALALLLAALLAGPLLRAMAERGVTRPNYRGRELPCPFGMLLAAAALPSLAVLALVARLGSADLFERRSSLALTYALGVLALGLIDDVLGTPCADGAARRAPRGLRGHAAALLRGELSTGAVKAAGSLGLALATMSYHASDERWLLASAVLVLATHVFNLLDVRPGRSAKLLVVLGVALSAGAADLKPLWATGLFAGPALVAGFLDLRERAMLGDAGASVLGALAGVWLVLTLSATGQWIALGVLAAVALYGELRSISELVERTPGLRQLDSWGRPRPSR